jgi:23S rRNA (guanine745-N1)-methyltransferase
MDMSTRALRRAARAHPAIGAVAWDVWQPLPVRDQAVSLVINVFAPRNGPEFRRVLRPDGALIVVTPAAGHLAELAGAGLLGIDDRKEERLATTLEGPFRLAGRQELAIPLRLSRAGAETLIAMGPSARHAEIAVIRERLARLPDPVPVTAAFQLSVYRPR